MLRHKHVLVRTDSTATVAYINHQGGLRSRRMSQLARHLLLWSQTWVKSLRAVHIPGELNRAADQLSRQSTHPLGKHQLIMRFLRGARRVNPPRPHLVPSWDLSVTLQGLQEAPFEPLASVELKHLSLKTALLTALASIKRVVGLQAFSVDEACLEFGPGDSHVILRPRPGYLPKVPTTPFRDTPGGGKPGLCAAVSSPRPAYICGPHSTLQTHRAGLCLLWRSAERECCLQTEGEPCPLGVHAHSTRSVASSYALAHGASLADICRAAGWATPNTFARFYNLRVEAVSSRVLT
ncbi:ORF V: Enzymatic polyprotein [Labeo rohita]|uniref:ORF V: Enzymatic polyprotein n=1 Tax=Labeo rohita TaxID=84645 RepID=A0ABQ8L740_LABRO|nr:ORF V: Enzymatic polyprotein [Labeo rohita]